MYKKITQQIFCMYFFNGFKNMIFVAYRVSTLFPLWTNNDIKK